MNCKHCNTTIDADAVFCSECGKSIGQDKPIVKADNATLKIPTMSQQAFYRVVVVVLLIIAFVFVIIYAKSNRYAYDEKRMIFLDKWKHEIIEPNIK